MKDISSGATTPLIEAPSRTAPDLAAHDWRRPGHRLEQEWRRDSRRNADGHVVAYPVKTEGGFSHGEPTTLVRDLGSLAVYTTAMPDHSRMFIRVSPAAAQDKGEMRLLFGWQDGVRQDKP